MEIKIELIKLGKTQRNLIMELQKLGYKISPGDMSAIISGALNTPKAKSVLEDTEKIINKWKEDSDAE